MNKLAQEIKRIGYNTVLPLIAPKKGVIKGVMPTNRLDDHKNREMVSIEAKPYCMTYGEIEEGWKVLNGQEVIEAAKQAGMKQVWVMVANEEAEKIEAKKKSKTVQMSYRDLQKVLKVARENGTVLKIKLNGSKKALQTEVKRLNLV